MPKITSCPTCGEALPPDAPLGICPECTLRSALLTNAGAPEIVGDYELLEEIGRGGMGVIYKARQISLDRTVAVKMILAGQFASPRENLRFQAEAQAAARLQHPHIVSIHEVGEHNGLPYFSMDFVDGQTLSDVVRTGPLPALAAAKHLIKVARALHFAHEQGVIHRDVKPTNVLVDAAGEPHVTDFGVAKRVDEGAKNAPDKSRLTLAGVVLGTPGYMAPEQADSRRGPVDRRSDVYALGALLYYLVTTRPPFVADTPHATIEAALQREPVAPRNLNPSTPRDLETICLKCLATEPARRYASAAALADDLERFLEDKPIQARAPGVAYRVLKLARRHRAVFRAAAAAAIVLILGIITTSLQAGRAKRAERQAGQTVAFLRTMLSGVSPEAAQGADTTLLKAMLERTARRVDKELIDQPAVEALIRLTVGEMQWRIGQSGSAQTHTERAWNLNRQLYGPQHTNTLLARHLLAAIKLDLNQLAPAETMARENLESRRVVLGPTAPDTARSLQLLASILSVQGRHTNAEPLLREAVELLQRGLVPDDPDLARAMNGLGVACYGQKKYPEAEKWFRRVLEVYHKSLGTNHPVTLAVLSNLAGVYFAQENLSEAEKVMREIVPIERHVHGPRDRSTLRAQSNLANVLQEQGKDEEAEPLIRETLKVQRVELPEGDRDSLRSMSILARLLQRQGKSEELGRLLLEIRDLQERSARSVPRGDFPANPGIDQKNAAQPTVPAPAKAPPENSTNRPVRAVLAPKKPMPSTAEARAAIDAIPKLTQASNLSTAGKFAEAEPLYRDVLQAFAPAFPETEEQVLSVKSSLGRCLAELAWTEHTNAAAALRSPSAGVVTNNPALPPSAMGAGFERAREAERILRDILAIREQDSEGPRWRTADVSNRLGFVLVVLAVAEPGLTTTQRVAQLRLAETWIDRSGYSISTNREIDHAYRRDLMSRFVRLYEAWDSVDSGTGKAAAAAAEWRRRLADYSRSSRRPRRPSPERSATNSTSPP